MKKYIVTLANMPQNQIACINNHIIYKDMSDKEMNLAILNKLYEIALVGDYRDTDKIWRYDLDKPLKVDWRYNSAYTKTSRS